MHPLLAFLPLTHPHVVCTHDIRTPERRRAAAATPPYSKRLDKPHTVPANTLTNQAADSCIASCGHANQHLCSITTTHTNKPTRCSAQAGVADAAARILVSQAHPLAEGVWARSGSECVPSSPPHHPRFIVLTVLLHVHQVRAFCVLLPIPTPNQ